jgi:enoyl-CoA hydratase/carnithine racemase
MGPSKVNAIDLAVSQRVHAIFTAVCYGHALRITIVTGTGKGFYSLGRDMKGAAQERITGALVASTNGGSVILNSKSWSVYS